MMPESFLQYEYIESESSKSGFAIQIRQPSQVIPCEKGQIDLWVSEVQLDLSQLKLTERTKGTAPIQSINLALRYLGSKINNPELIKSYSERQSNFVVPSLLPPGMPSKLNSQLRDILVSSFLKGESEIVLKTLNPKNLIPKSTQLLNIIFEGHHVEFFMQPPKQSSTTGFAMRIDEDIVLSASSTSENPIFCYLNALSFVNFFLTRELPLLQPLTDAYFPISICSSYGPEYIFTHNLVIYDALEVNFQKETALRG